MITTAVIGGTGLYSLLPQSRIVDVETPYGPPSGPVRVGEFGGHTVAFLPRHGEHHEHPPHQVPYRANLWALRSLGVRRVLAPCAVGSLVPDLGPGAVVAPDQLVDRTSGRAQTYVDAGGIHVSFADPYCPTIRSAAVAAGGRADLPDVVDGGTMVVVEGPRFSTRAESRWFAAQGWTLVNMTGHPEAVLARELGVCYAPLALVTDVDAGLTTGEGVTADDVWAEFQRNLEPFTGLVAATLAGLSPEPEPCPTCKADHTLPGIEL